MSDQNPDPTPDPPQDPQDPQQEPTEEPGGGGNAEAAKWRRALRATEAERDGLAERLDARDRRDVDTLLASRLQSPEDAWLDPDFTLENLRAEDGTIDMQKVEAEVARLEQQRPHWKKVESAVYPNQHQGARANPEPEGPSFGRTIKKALGG